MSDNRFVEFLLLSPSLAGYSLNSYYDKDGNVKFIPDRKDENGIQLKKRFKFNYNNRVYRVHKSQTDVVEFLRNAPECEGSPNSGDNQQYYFKEVNTIRDAETVVENEAKRIEAQSAALKLKGQDLADIALLCGSDSVAISMQQKRVLDYSGSNPDGFLEMLKSPDVKTRAIVRRAIDQNIITKKGFIYKWVDVHLGNDEDSTVKYLMSHKDIFKAIEEKVK